MPKTESGPTIQPATTNMQRDAMEGLEPRGLARALLARAAEHPGRSALVDAHGNALSYGELAHSALALAAALEARLGAPANEPRVGVLLPPGLAGALANVALAIAPRASVNLNPLAGAAGLEAQIARAGLARVITSRAALEALRGAGAPSTAASPLASRALCLEDLESELTPAALACAAARLEVMAASRPQASDVSDEPAESRAVATVLFSSGSTAVPKAIQLSHANVAFNARAVAAAFGFGPDDRLLGVLPLFHSFGYTVTLWAPLLAGASIAFHESPFDARTIGELAARERPSVLVATPAMLQAWMRRIEPASLASVRAAVVGAQKLPPALAAAWSARYGSELYEGYGATELSPVISANRPAPGGGARRLGTVGRPLDGVEIEVRDPATGEPLARGLEGDVWVRGPGVMLGYLDDEAATRRAVVDGWYDTQDVGRLDADGFLVLTDRRSRFSKLGGEMVSHGAVERALGEAAIALGESPDAFALAVTAVPDEERGERLVALHTPLTVPVAAVIDRARQDGLANLCAPRAADWFEVPALPMLGSGKLDLAKLKALAHERAKA